MRISVITPNFNGERFLNESLQSVIAQREAGVDLEYIVVDGNSADRSMDIIRRYGSAINMVICENDAGPANAINKGFRAATGEVVGWLNADDAYRHGALARVVKADSQGRVVLPEKSMQRAVIADKVTLVGKGDHVELWPTEEWEKYVEQALPRYGEDVLDAGDGLSGPEGSDK